MIHSHAFLLVHSSFFTFAIGMVLIIVEAFSVFDPLYIIFVEFDYIGGFDEVYLKKKKKRVQSLCSKVADIC